MATLSIAISHHVEIKCKGLRTYNHQSLWKYQVNYSKTSSSSYFNYILLVQQRSIQGRVQRIWFYEYFVYYNGRCWRFALYSIYNPISRIIKRIMHAWKAPYQALLLKHVAFKTCEWKLGTRNRSYARFKRNLAQSI